MVARIRHLVVLGCALVLAAAVVPAAAQIEDQLSAYTGANAEGYLEPLALAMGSNLNSGLFYSAYIPVEGFHIALEFPVMSVIFGDDDATFTAVTEDGFTPETEAEVSTVVGPGDGVIVENVDLGTAFAFPGGLDLNSFSLSAPQIRIGSVKGTEAVLRGFSLDVGDAEVGNLGLVGIGLRHSISQYMTDPPVDIAGGFMYQSFTLGDELIDATAFSIGVQVSKRIPSGFALIEPYGGLSYDMFSMDVSYEFDGEPITLEYDSISGVHLTLGLHAQAGFLSLFGEYNLAEQSGIGFGMAFGFKS